MRTRARRRGPYKPRKPSTRKASTRKASTHKSPNRKRHTRKRIRKRGGAAQLDVVHSSALVEREIDDRLGSIDDISRMRRIFLGLPRSNLDDMIAANDFMMGLKTLDPHRPEHRLYVLLHIYKLEPESRELLTSREFDYRTFGELSRSLARDTFVPFKMPLVMIKMYQFYVVEYGDQPKGEQDNVKGEELFRAFLVRLIENGVELSGLINKYCPRLTGPMVVRRGLSIPFETYRNTLVHAFSSTSIDPWVPENFSGREGFVMVLHLPVGFPIAFLGFVGECEITLPPWITLTQRGEHDVKPVRNDRGYLEVHYDVSLPDDHSASTLERSKSLWSVPMETFQAMFEESYPNHFSVEGRNKTPDNSQVDQYYNHYNENGGLQRAKSDALTEKVLKRHAESRVSEKRPVEQVNNPAGQHPSPRRSSRLRTIRVNS